MLGGDDSWNNVDSLAVDCKKECGAERAFYMQLQIRSADEPMTTFYRYVLLLLASGWEEWQWGSGRERAQAGAGAGS